MDLRERQKTVISAGVLAAAMAGDAFLPGSGGSPRQVDAGGQPGERGMLMVRRVREGSRLYAS